MRLLNSLAIAISMIPRFLFLLWTDEKNMKYAMCFFPVVGVITGILQFGIGYALLEYTSCGKFFFAAVMSLIPVLVTGGIHLDGYADTIDAISSYGDTRKETADTQRSAYGSICGDWAVCLFCGRYWRCGVRQSLTCCRSAACMYPLSRALSGISVVSFQSG